MLKPFTLLILYGIIILLASIDRVVNGAADPILVFGSIIAGLLTPIAFIDVTTYFKMKRRMK